MLQMEWCEHLNISFQRQIHIFSIKNNKLIRALLKMNVNKY